MEVAGTRGTLRLRPATPDDVPLLRRWDDAPHVIASDPNDDWQWDTELGHVREWREQLVAEVDGRPIGYLEILDTARDPEGYWGPDAMPGVRAIDLWIGEADALGQGHGSTMMRLALEHVFAEQDVTAVLVDPLEDNVRAQAFYQRLGFVTLGTRHFGEDRCRVHRLDRDDWEKRHSAAGVTAVVARVERTP